MSRVLIGLAAERSAHEVDRPLSTDLIELSQRHGLIPLLSEKSDDLLVRAILARERSRQATLKRHLTRILTRQNEGGVRVSVLKGPAIALRYRYEPHRPYSDLDLLVPESQLERALDLLASDPSTIAIPEKRPKADKRDVIVRDETGIRFNVDLHWDLFSYSQLRGSADGATDLAWAEARHVPDSPLGPLWELPDSFRVAFLCAHAVLDHRFRLILFRDFVEIAAQPILWDSVEDVAARWGLRSTTYLALWMSKQALGADVPSGFLSTVRPVSAPLSYLEWALPRVDIPRFDGHRPHPINLAAVLLNDSRKERASLLLRAPHAFPGWKRRVAAESHLPSARRVLILVSTDRRRGAEVFTEGLRDGLLARGWLTEALSLKGQGEDPRANLNSLMDQRFASDRRFDLRILRALHRKVRIFNPDIVIANGGATLRYAVAVDPVRKYKLVYMGIGEPDYWIRSRVSRLVNRLLLRRADRILTVSNATREQTIRLEPRIASRTHTASTGVPERLLQIQRSESTGPLRVLMIGSLSGEKDPQLALKAVARIPDAIIRFVGEGPLRGSLDSLAGSLEMNGRVEFLGSVADVTPHLEWAHVLILSSKSEGLPGAILEASAAGLPTVGVNVGGVSEAVVDGVGGYVTSRSIEEIVDALRKFNEDRRLVVEMGAAAREHVKRNFMMDDVIDRYAKFLERLLQ